MSVKNFYEDICNVAINYDKDDYDTYNEIYNICANYESECDCMEFFNDFIDYDTAEDIACERLKDYGLNGIKCFIGDCYLDADLFKLNGDGNLENITIDTLEILREDILKAIEAQME